MCTFIGVECLAANALIGLYENKIDRISLKQLAEYGLRVVDKYEMQNGDEAILIFNQEEIQGLVINYSDYFEIQKTENQKYICLKPNVDIRELKEQFRWTLPYNMLRVLSEVNVLEAVG